MVGRDPCAPAGFGYNVGQPIPSFRAELALDPESSLWSKLLDEHRQKLQPSQDQANVCGEFSTCAVGSRIPMLSSYKGTKTLRLPNRHFSSLCLCVRILKSNRTGPEFLSLTISGNRQEHYLLFNQPVPSGTIDNSPAIYCRGGFAKAAQVPSGTTE